MEADRNVKVVGGDVAVLYVGRGQVATLYDTEMATFTFEEQRVIIRFLHLRGMKPIQIHRQLSETCSDGVMDVKNVRS